MPSNLQQALLECGCGCGTTCCTERCNPYISELHPGDCTGAPGENPLPTTLTVEMTTDASTGCFTASTTVTLTANGRWGNGDLSSTCLWHNPVDSTAAFVTWYLEMNVIIQCTGGSGWGIEFRPKFSTNNPRTSFLPVDSTLTKVSCDPILLQGTVCFDPGMSSVVFPAVPPQPPLRHPTICLSFLVYETP
jgi:hypothetical protein